MAVFRAAADRALAPRADAQPDENLCVPLEQDQPNEQDYPAEQTMEAGKIRSWGTSE